MKIQVNSDKNVIVDAKLPAAVESELTRAFGKFQAPSGSVAGRSAKKKGIYRAWRKAWPSR